MVASGHSTILPGTRRQLLVSLASLSATALFARRPADAAPSPAGTGNIMPDTIAAPTGAHDFDFFVGDWKTQHRQLRHRLAGDTEWLEFSGTVSMRQILAGLGNIDEGEILSPRGRYTGVTLRLFDPDAGTWSIYWLDSRKPVIDTPMVGRFEQGVGLFYADEPFEGRPIRVRFIWTPVSANECRWEQAFSADGGTSWETNWTMIHTRA